VGQPEGRLSRLIIDLIKQRGGYAWKVHGNEFTPAGTPDIVGCYRGQFIAIETKLPEGDDLSARQRYVVGQMRKAEGSVLAPCRSVREASSWLDRLDALMRGRG
jgi:Holliday junction resolvase